MFEHPPERATIGLMSIQLQERILSQAIKKGIDPGHCPVCDTALVPSSRVPFAKVPDETKPAISFDCPISDEHIDGLNLKVYFLSYN
ncbi:MAG TPA: hypothetical protein VGN61_09560 [Verrucomicrobiae bacterium]